MQIKIISVVGARPNFMKMAPVHKALVRTKNDLNGREIKHYICHTGQHYDEKMSKVFFEDLELPKPDFYLGVGSASHAKQTAKIMIEFERILIDVKPDLVIVYGDVNSTVACALTASKLNIKIAHVEAGLRSFDRTMPEEINRIVTDHISDFLFVTERSGIENLKNEGIDDSKVFFVGNTMIDTLIEYLPRSEKSNIFSELGLISSKYVLVTLHRPSNIENDQFLTQLVTLFNTLAEEEKIVFPVHPRTKKNLQQRGIINKLSENVLLTDPIAYIDFIALTKNASIVITDSGGIQEETTFLNTPCLTLRENTERPVTIELGTNSLMGTDLEKTVIEAKRILKGNIKNGTIPDLWDGNASCRIVENIKRIY